jgi:hypothetical protein
MNYTPEVLAAYLLGRGAAVHMQSDHIVIAAYGEARVNFHFKSSDGEFSWGLVDSSDKIDTFTDPEVGVAELGLPAREGEAAA